MTRKKLNEHTCHACGQDYRNHKTKSVRCQDCLSANIKVKRKKCLSCDASVPKILIADSGCCNVCLLEWGTASLAKNNRTVIYDTEAKEIRREKIKRSAREQLSFLNRIGKAIPGFRAVAKEGKRMKYKQPISVLWLELVYQAGACNPLLADTEHDEATKLKMLMLYHRLRLRNFSAHSISQLDIEALLKKDNADIEAAFAALDEAAPRKPNPDWPENDENDVDDTYIESAYNAAEEQRRERIKHQLALKPTLDKINQSKGT